MYVSCVLLITIIELIYKMTSVKSDVFYLINLRFGPLISGN